MQFTLDELAEYTSTNLIGDGSYTISGVNALDEASNTDASFFANSRYLEAMKKTQAGVICIDSSAPQIEGKNYLISKDPSSTFQQIAEILLSKEENFSSFLGVHPTAIIHPSAQIAQDVSIGPYSVIDKGVKIREKTFIGSLVYIGPHSQIGENCILYSSCTIREKCILGKRVILQPGCVIGSCGFGYSQEKKGSFKKLQQLGNVVIEDDVEIGANTCIDRARFKSTHIRSGTKIDNLVQIAHNVEIGEDNALAAQTGIAGSAKTGKFVMMGGQVGVLGHVTIGNCVMLATRSGVSKSLPKKGKFRGSPAIDLSTYNRQKVWIKRLGHYVKTIETLKEKLFSLEKEVKELKKNSRE